MPATRQCQRDIRRHQHILPIKTGKLKRDSLAILIPGGFYPFWRTNPWPSDCNHSDLPECHGAGFCLPETTAAYPSGVIPLCVADDQIANPPRGGVDARIVSGTGRQICARSASALSRFRGRKTHRRRYGQNHNTPGRAHESEWLWVCH